MPIRPFAALLAFAFTSFGPPAAAKLTIARLQYDGGGDWYANPSSLPNLLKAINERTNLKVEPTEARISLKDDRLWDHPFLHVTGHGEIKLSDLEVTRLREYLNRGGFLHVMQVTIPRELRRSADHEFERSAKHPRRSQEFELSLLRRNSADYADAFDARRIAIAQVGNTVENYP